MSVKITPADEKIEFLDNAGNLDAKISLDGSGNLKLENFNGGSMVLGDPTADIYVGDGSASVDIVYDVGGRLYSTANQHLTIGKSSLGGNDIVIDSPNWSVTDGGIFTFKEGKIIDTNDTSAVGLTLQNSEGSIYLYTNGDDLIFKNVDDNTFPFHMLNGSASNTLIMDSIGVTVRPATANATIRVQADTNSSPAPRLELMRGEHDTWGTGDNYTDWRIENSNDLIFYSGFSSQSSGAAVERFRIHSDADGLSINGTLLGLGQFVIFGEEADLYSGNGSTGNANGYQFSYGDRRVNVTNASGGTDFGINVPHNCTLERVDVVFGNSGNVSSGTTTFVVVKNGSNQSGNLSTTHSSGVHDSHHTGLSHTFSAGDRFNLRTTTSSRQVGPMRMTATFKRTA